MGKITGFLEIERHDRKYAAVPERIKNYREFVVPLSDKDTRDQAARCMNCGIPYCHGTGSVAPGTPGCPVNVLVVLINGVTGQSVPTSWSGSTGMRTPSGPSVYHTVPKLSRGISRGLIVINARVCSAEQSGRRR